MMKYIFYYGSDATKAFGGQFDNFIENESFMVVRLEYGLFSVLYKILWCLVCLLTLSKPQAFMFLGIGYRLYDERNKKIIRDVKFNQEDIIIFANQTAPKSIINAAKKNRCKIVRWCDLTLSQLLYQRYKIGFVPMKILTAIENKLIETADCFFTNDYAADNFNKNNKKVGTVVGRIVSEDFYINKQFKLEKNIPYHVIYIGVDYVRKRLDLVIDLYKKLKKTHCIELIVIGVDKKINFDDSHFDNDIKFLGKMTKREISQYLSSIDSRGFFNITATRDEGAPIVMLELQALGTICFCLNDSGSTSYLANKSFQSDCVMNMKSEIIQIMNSDYLLFDNIKKSKAFVEKNKLNFVIKALI